MEIRKAVLGYIKACFYCGVAEMGPSQKACNMFTSCDKFCGVLLTLEDFLVSKQADGF